MPYVIRNVELVGQDLGVESPPAGLYLSYYDPDAVNGYGAADWTDDPAKALHFDNPQQAFVLWHRQGTIQPLRPDGKPNRPLTAFTIMVEEVE